MKKLTLPLALVTMSSLLASCGGGSAPEIDPSTTKITGVVSSGSGSGAGTVSLKGNNGVLATAPVDGSGNFSLTLPEAGALSGQLKPIAQVLNDVGCAGNISADAAANGFAVFKLDLTRGGTNAEILAGTLNVTKLFGLPTGGSFDGRMWMYSDKATTLSGQVNCQQVFQLGFPVNISVNAPLKAGWNILSLTGKAGLSGGSIAINGNLAVTSDATTTWRTFAELTSALQ